MIPNYDNALQNMMTVANIISPTGKEQAAFAWIVAEMQKDNQNPSDILVQVILAAADGLRYGNWPNRGK